MGKMKGQRHFTQDRLKKMKAVMILEMPITKACDYKHTRPPWSDKQYK